MNEFGGGGAGVGGRIAAGTTTATTTGVPSSSTTANGHHPSIYHHHLNVGGRNAGVVDDISLSHQHNRSGPTVDEEDLEATTAPIFLSANMHQGGGDGFVGRRRDGSNVNNNINHNINGNVNHNSHNNSDGSHDLRIDGLHNLMSPALAGISNPPFPKHHHHPSIDHTELSRGIPLPLRVSSGGGGGRDVVLGVVGGATSGSGASFSGGGDGGYASAPSSANMSLYEEMVKFHEDESVDDTTTSASTVAAGTTSKKVKATTKTTTSSSSSKANERAMMGRLMIAGGTREVVDVAVVRANKAKLMETTAATATDTTSTSETTTPTPSNNNDDDCDDEPDDRKPAADVVVTDYLPQGGGSGGGGRGRELRITGGNGEETQHVGVYRQPHYRKYYANRSTDSGGSLGDDERGSNCQPGGGRATGGNSSNSSSSSSHHNAVMTTRYREPTFSDHYINRNSAIGDSTGSLGEDSIAVFSASGAGSEEFQQRRPQQTTAPPPPQTHQQQPLRQANPAAGVVDQQQQMALLLAQRNAYEQATMNTSAAYSSGYAAQRPRHDPPTGRARHDTTTALFAGHNDFNERTTTDESVLMELQELERKEQEQLVSDEELARKLQEQFNSEAGGGGGGGGPTNADQPGVGNDGGYVGAITAPSRYQSGGIAAQIRSHQQNQRQREEENPPQEPRPDPPQPSRDHTNVNEDVEYSRVMALLGGNHQEPSDDHDDPTTMQRVQEASVIEEEQHRILMRIYEANERQLLQKALRLSTRQLDTTTDGADEHMPTGHENAAPPPHVSGSGNARSNSEVASEASRIRHNIASVNFVNSTGSDASNPSSGAVVSSEAGQRSLSDPDTRETGALSFGAHRTEQHQQPTHSQQHQQPTHSQQQQSQPQRRVQAQRDPPPDPPAANHSRSSPSQSRCRTRRIPVGRPPEERLTETSVVDTPTSPRQQPPAPQTATANVALSERDQREHSPTRQYVPALVTAGETVSQGLSQVEPENSARGGSDRASSDASFDSGDASAIPSTMLLQAADSVMLARKQRTPGPPSNLLQTADSLVIHQRRQAYSPSRRTRGVNTEQEQQMMAATMRRLKDAAVNEGDDDDDDDDLIPGDPQAVRQRQQQQRPLSAGRRVPGRDLFTSQEDAQQTRLQRRRASETLSRGGGRQDPGEAAQPRHQQKPRQSALNTRQRSGGPLQMASQMSQEQGQQFQHHLSSQDHRQQPSGQNPTGTSLGQRGVSLPLPTTDEQRDLIRRGQEETVRAVQIGQSQVVECRGCGCRLQAPVGYRFVYCPTCGAVSPVVGEEPQLQQRDVSAGSGIVPNGTNNASGYPSSPRQSRSSSRDQQLYPRLRR